MFGTQKPPSTSSYIHSKKPKTMCLLDPGYSKKHRAFPPHRGGVLPSMALEAGTGSLCLGFSVSQAPFPFYRTLVVEAAGVRGAIGLWSCCGGWGDWFVEDLVVGFLEGVLFGRSFFWWQASER